MDIRKLIKEAINEVDWSGAFGDVNKQCLLPGELLKRLNYVLANHEKPDKEKEKRQLDKPYIHNKVISKDADGEIDVDKFIDDITQMPSQIIAQNGKIEKSSTEWTIVYDIGIPALKALVYDENEKKFYYVNTCPGAGECMLVCYALSGSYIMFPKKFKKQTQIVNLLMNRPEQFKSILQSELELVCIRNRGKTVILRWNDAGDFFAKKYYDISLEITNELTKKGYDFESYGYTKMGDVMNLERPKNYTMNFSDGANKREADKVDMKKVKLGVTVPLDLFKDLFVLNKNKSFYRPKDGTYKFIKDGNLDILKDRLADKYGVDRNSIFSYDEMLSMPRDLGRTINVIVMPGEGDISAQRSEVRITFLLQH